MHQNMADTHDALYCLLANMLHGKHHRVSYLYMMQNTCQSAVYVMKIQWKIVLVCSISLQEPDMRLWPGMQPSERAAPNLPQGHTEQPAWPEHFCQSEQCGLALYRGVRGLCCGEVPTHAVALVGHAAAVAHSSVGGLSTVLFYGVPLY